MVGNVPRTPPGRPEKWPSLFIFSDKQELALTPAVVSTTKHSWAFLARTSPHCDAILLTQPGQAMSKWHLLGMTNLPRGGLCPP